MSEICEILRFWEKRAGTPLALATLVAAHGSSYRRPGARMLISFDGESAGGVSAGCIEEEVIACARKVIRSQQPQLMTFDTRRRFGCHGTIEVFVEPVADELLAELQHHVTQRQNCRVVTVARGPITTLGTRIGSFESVDENAFAQTIEPVIRLVIFCDSSDTIALRRQAALLGWEVIDWGTRNTFAGSATNIVPSDFLDSRTAVVIATHNFGRDAALLRGLLPLGLPYVGLIGSRRRRDDLLFDLLQDGVDCTSALFAPAGLHLGADTPEEIALSIIAEIQSVFAHGTGEQLRQRKAPIHVAAPEHRVARAESAA